MPQYSKKLFFNVVASCFLSQSIFIWAKNTDRNAGVKPKNEAAKPVEIASAPMPEIATMCAVNADCRVVEPPCGGVAVVNNLYESEIKKTFVLEGTRVDCEQMTGANKKVYKPECRMGRCELVGAQDIALKSKDLWMQKCPVIETTNKIDDLGGEVRSVVQRLMEPIGSVRKKALADLTKMGDHALPALPWVINQFKSRSTFDSECFFGEPPENIDYVDAMGAIEKGDHPALPILLEWLKDEKNRYRHTDILKVVAQMGHRASGAIAVLLTVADRANDANWTDERGDLAVDALVAIGGESKKVLTTFEKWVSSSKKHKAKLFKAMILIDPNNSVTQRAGLAVAKQSEDADGRALALNYLIFNPKDLNREIDWLKKSLTDANYSSSRFDLLRLARRMGKDAIPLVPDLASIITQNQDDLRRLSALILHDIDIDGKGSVDILKKRVYHGFAFESQYAWKLMGFEKAQIELLKSYVYYVVGKRFQFTEVKVAPENETKLVQCLVSADCSNKTSAVAALQLLNSNHADRYKNLVAAMDSAETALKWDAATSLLLWAGVNSSLGKMTKEMTKEMTKAIQIQKEAVETGGYVRHLDLEDVLLATNVWDESLRNWLLKALLSNESTTNNEVTDAVIVLANRGDVLAQKALADLARQGDKQRVLAVIQRMALSRAPLGTWVSDYFKQINFGGDSAFQDLIWQKQMALLLPVH